MSISKKTFLTARCFILIFLALVTHKNFSQIREYEVPSIIPPSPTATAFARYDDIPVDVGTGIPQITLPLYTIKTNQLEIPLTLSYHASGIKLNDVATPVGLGWVISGMTGLVSRTVLDRPDEDFIKYNNGWGGRAVYSSEESFQTQLTQLTQTNASLFNFGAALFEDIKYKDKQADRYNYQLPGRGSGGFRFDFNTGVLVRMPYRPVNIVMEPMLNDEIPAFTVVDEKGTKYTFDKPYKSKQENGYCSYCYNGTANTSWYLTRIESADGTDVIEYEYAGLLNTYTTGNFSDSYVWGIFDPEYNSNCSNCDRVNPILSENYRSYQFTTTFEPLLTRIVSSTAIVQFGYSADRMDMPGANYRLNTLKVVDPVTGNTIKAVSFDNNHYFGEPAYLTNGEELWGSRRLSLRGVTINDQRGGHTYTFDYIDGNFPPYNTQQRINLNQKLTFAEDYWGYYNGKNSNKGLVPLEFINCPIYIFPFYWGNRRPDAAYAQIWSLKEIRYPTGGISEFFYEGHTAMNEAVGGLRVKKVVHTDPQNPISTTKTYSYTGYSPFPLRQELFGYTQYYNWDFSCTGNPGTSVPGMAQRYTNNSSSFLPLSLYGQTVIYSRVVETTVDTENNENNGRIEYTFDKPDHPVPETYDRTSGAYWNDMHYTPLLLSKKILKKNDDGTYVPVHETINTYSSYFDQEYHMGVDIFQTTYDIDPGTGNHVETGYLIGQSCSEPLPPYIAEQVLYAYVLRVNNHRANTKVSLLTQTIENQYCENDTITQVTDIEYNLNNLQPNIKSTIGSDGVTLRTEYQYTTDFPTDPVYAKMIDRNILTPVVETRTYRGTTFLESVRTNYSSSWQGTDNLILPETVVGKVGNNPAEVRVRYHEYDERGNILTISRENDAKQSFIWGYEQSLPIAKAINARARDIFHTSFEEPPFDAIQPAKTGKKNGSGTFTKTLTTLSNGEYELSYWKFEGNPGRWIRYVESVIITNSTNGSNGTYTINISGASFDEVRFHPKDAQMFTFTYQPLVGLTSSTDAASQTTYYKYDHEGRLSSIQDNQRNLVEKIGYSYQGSPVTLIEGAFYNRVTYGHFTRDNCATGYIGTQYTYVVPANKHYSLVSQEAADLLAQADSENNGQAQANLYGTCIPAFANTKKSQDFQVSNCPSGFTGVSITYTVYPGMYRATTQEGADQLALQDIAVNGQAFANQFGLCYDASLPFVSLTYENPTTQSVPDGNGGVFQNFYQDVVVRFYEDAQRTIPMSVSNLQLTIVRNWYVGEQYGTENQTFTVSGASALLYDNLLFWGYDANGLFHEESFTLLPGAGYNAH